MIFSPYIGHSSLVKQYDDIQPDLSSFCLYIPESETATPSGILQICPFLSRSLSLGSNGSRTVVLVLLPGLKVAEVCVHFGRRSIKEGTKALYWLTPLRSLFGRRCYYYQERFGVIDFFSQGVSLVSLTVFVFLSFCQSLSLSIPWSVFVCIPL